MALNIGISYATVRYGYVVAYSQGASFSSAVLRRITAPYRYELWTSRGREPVAVVYAKSDKIAKEYLNDKFNMKGLRIEKIATKRRRVK